IVVICIIVVIVLLIIVDVIAVIYIIIIIALIVIVVIVIRRVKWSQWGYNCVRFSRIFILQLFIVWERMLVLGGRQVSSHYLQDMILYGSDNSQSEQEEFSF
ncbi:MAG: hypothetical protein EZS28_047365, partial [Streblomastix strix]